LGKCIVGKQTVASLGKKKRQRKTRAINRANRGNWRNERRDLSPYENLTCGKVKNMLGTGSFMTQRERKNKKR